MYLRYAKDCLRQQNGQHIGHTGCGNADCHISKQGNFLLQHQLTHKVAHACAKESTDHFHGAAAQQKCKCTAGNCRCKSQIPCLIVRRFFLDLIQHQVNLLDGKMRCLFRELSHELFQFCQFIRIYACGGQRDRMSICSVLLIAGILNGQ